MTDTPDYDNTADVKEILDEDLEIVSMAGRILGTLRGRLDVATEAFNIAYQNGAHEEVELAGYCEGHEVRDEEFHADPKQPRIVVLCGSTRFYDAFQQANYDETMAGRIVLSVGFYPHAKAIHGHGEGVGHDSAEKIALDELHLRKIDLADEVLVLNVNGYIGDSTRREIAYATATGKPIRWLEQPAAERPLPLCLAPDPTHPGSHCRRPLGHSATICDYAPSEPDTVRFIASEYADKLTFDATPQWLTKALETGDIKGVFKGEDYWYLEVRTPNGVVTAEPGDTINRHHDGGLLVRSPDGLCKKIDDAKGNVLADLAALKEAIDRQPYEPQLTFMTPGEYERAKTDPRWTGQTDPAQVRVDEQLGSFRTMLRDEMNATQRRHGGHSAA